MSTSIFRGHQYLYERTFSVVPKTGVRDDDSGIGVITVGGGCVGYRPEDPSGATPLWFDVVVSLRYMHYLVVRLDGQRLQAEAKNLDGNVFDRFAIRKLPNGSREWQGLPFPAVFLVENKPVDD